MSGAVDRTRMKLIEWKPLHKNTLRGFCVVELPSGLILREVSVHEKNGKRWAGMPAKPQIRRDGQPIVNHAGHKQYQQLVGWRDRDLSDRFAEALIAWVEAERGPIGGGQ